MNPLDRSSHAHQAGIYGSDEDFLAFAVPFVLAGLQAGEPVLAATTPANLELLGRALGPQAQELDHAESAYFGRRPVQRVTAFHRYWRRHANRGRVRILAEPLWTGRSEDQITAWRRMESGLNLALAGTGVHMICPYDTRVLAPDLVAGALRTHPERVAGRDVQASSEYADPHDFTRECDAAPLPPPPDGAAALCAGDDLRGLRRFVAGQAAALGLGEERAALMVLAAGEAATYLKNLGTGPATVTVWAEFGAAVCEVHVPGGRVNDPIAGLRPPGRVPGPGDGMHLAHQLCDRVEIRTDDSGSTIRLYVAGPRSEELAQAGSLHPTV